MIWMTQLPFAPSMLRPLQFCTFWGKAHDMTKSAESSIFMASYVTPKERQKTLQEISKFWQRTKTIFFFIQDSNLPHCLIKNKTETKIWSSEMISST
jgi:hypothetical protein